MIRDDEDALICDFAETYQIYDYRSLPLRLVATLAAGLRENSRIKSAGAKASVTNTLLAMIADQLTAIRRILGDDIELPSIIGLLHGMEQEDKSKVKAYESGDAFMDAWQALNGE